MATMDEALTLAPVLIVSADSRTRQGMHSIFDTWGIPADEAEDTVDAAEKLLFRNPHSAVICDESLPSGTADDLCRLLLWQGMEMPFVVAVSNPWNRISRNPRLRMLEKPLRTDSLWDTLNELMDGALAHYQQALDARDAAEWSRQCSKPPTNPFLLCDSAGMDQSVGRRNDPVPSLFEAGR